MRKELVVQVRTNPPAVMEAAVLPQPHSGDTGMGYITSWLAYLSSGGWSSRCSEAFGTRRKKLMTI